MYPRNFNRSVVNVKEILELSRWVLPETRDKQRFFLQLNSRSFGAHFNSKLDFVYDFLRKNTRFTAKKTNFSHLFFTEQLKPLQSYSQMAF